MGKSQRKADLRLTKEEKKVTALNKSFYKTAERLGNVVPVNRQASDFLSRKDKRRKNCQKWFRKKTSTVYLVKCNAISNPEISFLKIGDKQFTRTI